VVEDVRFARDAIVLGREACDRVHGLVPAVSRLVRPTRAEATCRVRVARRRGAHRMAAAAAIVALGARGFPVDPAYHHGYV
jgi:hypothetical protein